MGFFSRISRECEKFVDGANWAKEKAADVVNWVIEKVEDAVDWVTDKLSRKKYDEHDVEDHVDVDAVLAEFRESIQDEINGAEKRCMDSVSVLFADLIEKTQDKFPDLVEIIRNEQQKAENELKGTVMRYVKEHLSKNDAKFLRVLKMNPGKAKEEELDLATKNVLNDAEKSFNAKLKTYAEHVLEEFSGRLNNRILNQESQMNARLHELEKLQLEAESGQIDIKALEDKAVPTMEISECIIQIFRMEM